MTNLISCPNCQTEIAISEVLKAQMSDQIRAELNAEVRAKQTQLDTARKQLDQQLLEAKQTQATLENQIAAGVEEQSKKILADATKAAESKLAVEIQDQKSQLAELEGKLKQSQTHELELRERERKLQSEKQELKLAAAREVDAQRSQIREEALKQFSDEHRLKDAEQQKRVDDMKKQIDELKRKAEQGSQQIQGEVQELALEAMLESAFASDTIDPVPKGITGADCLQHVHCNAGTDCGSILWESKRTKAWSKQWLPKLRDDQRASRAACAVIVTQALPEGVDRFALVDGVWVCDWASAKGLAMALRQGLIDVNKTQLASEGRAEKMELVYNYLSGREFQRCVEGIVEAFGTMQSDLDREKASMQTLWKRRQKQIERAVSNTAGMYGDLIGIIGNSMPVVDGLTLPKLDGPESQGHLLETHQKTSESST